mmetsp:Transcript_84799/g.150154  ORF Transcript_84799/g.150154 Transcript_84799/m.150154 type:complete len:550 (-) Transcript_84799:125-1774(-)
MIMQPDCDNQPTIERGPGEVQGGACVPFHDGALGLMHPIASTAYNEVTSLKWDDQMTVLPVLSTIQVLEPQPSTGEHESMDSAAGDKLQGPPTVPLKELMKLRKKLREIEKIESLMAAGDTKIDPLQKAKVEKKADVVSKIALAENTIKETEQTGTLSSDQMQILWAPVLIPIESFTEEGLPCQPLQNLQDQHDIHPHLMEFDMCDITCDAEELQARHMVAAAQAQMHAQCIAALQLGHLKEQQQLHSAVSQPQDTWTPQPLHSQGADHAFTAHSAPADLLKCLESDDESLGEVVAALRGAVLSLSLDSTGCRLVQLAIQLADPQTAAELAGELQGHVHLAIKSPHGNYVIQQVIEMLPPAQCNFIIQELLGFGAFMARHRFGCRILCRLLEHCADEADLLISEVLAEAVDLSRHAFAHHVLQSILEHGTVEQHQKIVLALCSDLQTSLSNRNASFVVEKVLIYCGVEEQHKIIDALLASKSEVLEGALRGRLGPQLRKASPKVASIASLKALDDVHMASGRLHGSKHWKRSWKKLGHAAAAPPAVAAM